MLEAASGTAGRAILQSPGRRPRSARRRRDTVDIGDPPTGSTAPVPPPFALTRRTVSRCHRPVPPTGPAHAGPGRGWRDRAAPVLPRICLLYTSDAADERSSVDLGGRRI